MAARDRVEALDGAPLQRTTTVWHGFFEGSVSVENVDEQGGVIRFELLLPTSESDIGDYIWTDELERGTTDKVVLSQAARPIEEARVVGIAREGKDERWVRA